MDSDFFNSHPPEILFHLKTTPEISNVDLFQKSDSLKKLFIYLKPKVGRR